MLSRCNCFRKMFVIYPWRNRRSNGKILESKQESSSTWTSPLRGSFGPWRDPKGFFTVGGQLHPQEKTVTPRGELHSYVEN
jgi:hypothetical protein